MKQAWVYGLVVAMGMALASPLAQANDMAETVKSRVNASTVVEYTTGINPDDYPCAKARILSLYEQQGKLADLSRYHPKRLFAWVMDTSIYYTYRFVDFLKGLMNPDTVADGIRSLHRMATSGGNPLAGMDSKVEGWVRDLSPRNQYVLQKKVQGIISDSTSSNGSCS